MPLRPVSHAISCNRQTDMTELIVAFCNFLSVSNKVQFSICLIEHHDMKAYGGVLALGQYHDNLFCRCGECR